MVDDFAFLRDYIGADHEFAEHDGWAHQVEANFSCQLAPDCVYRRQSAYADYGADVRSFRQTGPMEIRARVHLRPTHGGGLREPMPSPCQSFLLRLDGSSTDFGTRIICEVGESLTPGHSYDVTMTFWADDPEVQRIEQDDTFTLRYPSRVVAEGQVTDVRS